MFSLPSLRDLGYMALELLLCLLLAFIWGLHEHYEGILYQKAQEKAAVVKVDQKAAIVTTKIVTQYVPQIEYIKGETVTITKKVPVYVTKKDDSKCTVGNGFVGLWNATNKMQLPASAGTVDDRPSPVVLSDIAAQHTAEVSVCTATEAQRDALKAWILGQQKAYNGK